MIAAVYLESALKEFHDYKKLGDKTFAQINEKDFRFQPNEECNSIAINIQHMHGNMLSRWTNFLTEDGEKKWRQRDDEFELHDYKKEQLLELWEKGWTCFFSSVESLKKKDLKKIVHIRQEPLTVIDAINRQLAHYPYHVGQIIHIAKIIKGKNWATLSIAKGGSNLYNATVAIKDPAEKFQ